MRSVRAAGWLDDPPTSFPTGTHNNPPGSPFCGCGCRPPGTQTAARCQRWARGRGGEGRGGQVRGGRVRGRPSRSPSLRTRPRRGRRHRLVHRASAAPAAAARRLPRARAGRGGFRGCGGGGFRSFPPELLLLELVVLPLGVGVVPRLPHELREERRRHQPAPPESKGVVLLPAALEHPRLSAQAGGRGGGSGRAGGPGGRQALARARAVRGGGATAAFGGPQRARGSGTVAGALPRPAANIECTRRSRNELVKAGTSRSMPGQIPVKHPPTHSSLKG